MTKTAVLAMLLPEKLLVAVDHAQRTHARICGPVASDVDDVWKAENWLAAHNMARRVPSWNRKGTPRDWNILTKGHLAIKLIRMQQAHLDRAMGGKARRAKFIGTMSKEAEAVRFQLYELWWPS
jgi:hypothetical protein